MDARKLRIVYMGTPDFAVAPLRALVEGGYNVAAVVTMPDKPAGRGLKMQQSAVKRYAVETGLLVMQPERLKDEAFLARLADLRPDLGIVVAFRMLPRAVWAMPKAGTFNLHASLLPQYRGAAPINRAVMNGETVTGVTTFMLNDRMDEGGIIDRAEVPVLPDDDAGTLHDRLMEAGAGLVVDTVERIAAGNVSLFRQDDIDPDSLKPAPKIFRSDCRLDFTRPGTDIVNHVRGLSPYPGAWAELNPVYKRSEPLDIKIYKAYFEEAVHGEPCGAVSSDGRGFIRVACPDGWIYLTEVQLPGRRRMSAAELLRGFGGIEDYSF